MQPLHKCFFKPLKLCYCWWVQQIDSDKPWKKYSISFASCSVKLIKGVLQKATNAFRFCGIWPINPDIFTDQDSLPSSVTDLLEAPENHEASDNMD
jgi:hypothetical protein